MREGGNGMGSPELTLLKGAFSKDHVRLDGVGRPSPGPQWSLYLCNRLSCAGAGLAAEPPCLWLPGGAECGGPCLHAARPCVPGGFFTLCKVRRLSH